MDNRATNKDQSLIIGQLMKLLKHTLGEIKSRILYLVRRENNYPDHCNLSYLPIKIYI